MSHVIVVCPCFLVTWLGFTGQKMGVRQGIIMRSYIRQEGEREDHGVEADPNDVRFVVLYI